MTDADPRAGREAARLLAAAQDWLRGSAPHLAPTAFDGEPCSCPLCRAVAGVRDADPESVGRWVDAAVSSVGALLSRAADLASATTSEGDAASAPEPHAGDTGPTSSPASAPDEGATRQDGAGPRRVRRVPVTRAEDGEQTTS